MAFPSPKPPSSSSSSSSSPTPSITWSNCTAQDPPGVQCGQISVPLDYGNPQGDKITLGMVRFNASSSSRLGSLIYNPGGPGGAASQVVLAAPNAPLFSKELMAQYDLIGLDPRGVGMSSLIKCDPKIWNERISTFPKDEDSFKKLVAHNKALGASCVNMTGPLINHLDTTNVVKDMELVRLALKDGKLNFLGQSYGSLIGSQYAELYPQNINRMALDGIVDHSQSETSTLAGESTTYELTLNNFFDWCNTTTNCSLHGQDARTIVDSLVKTADTKPIPAPGCAPTGDNPCRADVTGEEILINVQGLLTGQNASIVSPTGWAELSSALLEATKGNATNLSTPLATSNTFPDFAGTAIGCQDWLQTSTSLADLQLKTEMTAITAPHTRGLSQTYSLQSGCIGWPAPVTNPQHYLDKKVVKAPPVLLVNSWYDPSTSIVWANGVKNQMPGSVLVTREGAGHTSYFLSGDASRAIDAFLLKGKMPKEGTVFNS